MGSSSGDDDGLGFFDLKNENISLSMRKGSTQCAATDANKFFFLLFFFFATTSNSTLFQLANATQYNREENKKLLADDQMRVEMCDSALYRAVRSTLIIEFTYIERDICGKFWRLSLTERMGACRPHATDYSISIFLSSRRLRFAIFELCYGLCPSAECETCK